MAMASNNALRDAIAAEFLSLFPGATLTIRSGAAPGPNNAATGDVLATLTLDTPAFEDTGNGVIDLPAPIVDASADDDGTAAHFRVVSASTTHVFEGTVGVSGSGADLIVDNTSFAAGQSFTISSLAITFGA